MKKILSRISLLSMIAVFGLSCADHHDIDMDEFYSETFTRWMEKNRPEATREEGKYAGLYTEWIEQDDDAQKLRTGYWFKLNYTAYDLYGNAFITRNEQYAKQLGFFPVEDRIQYRSDLVQYNPTDLMSNSYYAIGQVFALSMMGLGDSLRVYMPSVFGFSSTYFSSQNFYLRNYGYTNANVPTNIGLVYEMKIVEIIKDIRLYETEMVQKFAQDSLGIANLTDTLITGAYMKKLQVNEEGDSVKSDSKVTTYYVGRYLDGFVFDTNVDSIAVANGIKNYSKEPVEWDLSSVYSTPIEGFKAALLNMLEGEHARVVFISSLGYGDEGSTNSSGAVTIPGYSPLEFEIWVETVENPSDDDEEEEE